MEIVYYVFSTFSLIHFFAYVVGDFDLTVELGKPDTIISPGYYYSRYPSDKHTSWTLTSTHDIFLYCVDIDIETCCDVVYISFLSEVYHNIYQVDSTHLLQSKKAFLQSHERIEIVFTSNESREGRGFVFKYLALSKNRQNAKNAEEYFAGTEKMSQLVLNRLDDTTTAPYILTIKASKGYKLRISVVYTDMEPSVYCIKDFVQVYVDHSKAVLLRKCGNATSSAPVVVTSQYDHVTVEYSCQISSFSDEMYLSKICAVLNYQAFSGEYYDDSSHIEDTSVNFQSSPSWLGAAYESMFTLDTSHILVALTSVTGFGLKLQRYPDKRSKSDYIEILLDFHNGSMLTTNISMNIMGRPMDFLSDQRFWYRNTTNMFWILVKDARLWFGHGTVVSVDTMFYVDMRRLFEFNAVSLKGNMGNAKILPECDSLYIAENRTLLTNIFGEVYYTLLSNSYTYQLWLIQTSSEDEMIRLDITENKLAVTPDCLLERVSIYWGNCPRKSRRLTYFCGTTIEIYTQSVGIHTAIEYISSPIPISVLKDQGLLADRFFTISYQFVTPPRTISAQEQTPKSLHAVAILAGVCIFFVIIIVVVISWKLKATTRPVLPHILHSHPHQVLQAGSRPNHHSRRNHRIASYINQPGRLASLPHTRLGHHSYGCPVETSAVFRGVAPSAFHSRQQLSTPSSGRTRFGLPRRH